MRAGTAAEKAELMLNGNGIDMAEIDVVGRTDVVVLDTAADFELDGITVLMIALLHCDNEGLEGPAGRISDILDEITRKSGDAALSRRIR